MTTQSAVCDPLDLDDRLPRARPVGLGEPFGDDAVESRHVKPLHPFRCDVGIERGRRNVERERLDAIAPFLERQLPDLLSVPEQDVEDDEAGRDLGRQPPDAALGRVQAHLHGVEIEPPLALDDDLAVHRRSGRQTLSESRRSGK